MATATLEGGLVTDAVRLAGIEGDALPSPDSSVGIWPATTNDLPNGNFGNGTTGWTPTNAALTASAEQARFGALSGKLVANGVGAASIFQDTSPATAGVRAVAVWVYATAGAVGKLCKLQVFEVGGSQGSSLFAQYSDPVNGTSGKALVAGWQHLTCSGSVIQPDRTAIRLSVILNNDVGTTPPNGTTVYVGGCQVERTAIPTPYVNTVAAAATRAAGRVRVPVNNSPSRGWAVLRFRPTWASTAPPSSSVVLWRWADDAAHVLSLAWEADAFVFRRTDAGGTETATVRALFVAGISVTVIARWTPTRCSLSASGGAFANGTTQDLSDTFERADTASGLGTATSGQVWQFMGQHEGRILSGRYQGKDIVADPYAYAAVYERIDLTAPPVRRTAQVSYSGTTGQHLSTTMISTNDPTQIAPGLAFRNMLHPVIGPGAWFVSVYDWDGNNAIPTTLVSGNWALVTGASFFNAGFGFNQLYTDGRVYDITIDVDAAASAMRIVVAQGAAVVLDRTIVDSRIATHHGRYLIWQVARAAGFELTEDVVPRFDAITGSIAADTDAVTPRIPAIAATLADVGSKGDGTGHLFGDVLSFAAGAGTLSDADAATIAAVSGELTQATPGVAALPRAAWPANDATLWAYEAMGSVVSAGRSDRTLVIADRSVPTVASALRGGPTVTTVAR